MLAALTAAAIVFVGIFAAAASHVSNRQSASSRFDAETGPLLATLTAHVRSYPAVAYASAGFLTDNEDATRLDWQRFVDKSDLIHLVPGASALAFMRNVPGNISDFESQVAADPTREATGTPAFRVWPNQTADQYYIVDYVWPQGRFENAFGNNQFLDPARRAALETARDTGRVAMTAPLQHLGGDNDSSSVLFYAPIYLDGAFPASVAERRALLVGFAAVLAEVGVMAATLLDADIALEILDLGTVEQPTDRLVYGRALGSSWQDADVELRVTEDVEIANHVWRLFAWREKPELSLTESVMPFATALFYLIFGTASGGMVYYWKSRETRARAIAGTMTVSLQESMDRLDQAQQVARLGSWEIDLIRGTHVWSNQLYRLFGVTPETYTPTPRSFLDFIHPEDRDHVREGMERFSVTPSPFTDEARVITGDGEVRSMRVTCRIVNDESGRPIRMLGVVQDVTAQRVAQDAVAQAFDRKLQVDKLQAASEERARLLNVMAHELNNPLTSLQLQTYLLSTGSVGPLTEQQAKSVCMLDRGVRRLGLLVADIKDVGRLQAGAMKFVPRAVDLAGVLEEAVLQLTPVAKQSDVVLSSASMGPMETVADPDRIMQVLQNLIGNAIKYAPPGTTVDVSASLVGDEVVVQVTDRGPGIPSSQLAHLFKPFSQVLPAGVQKPGTGLGLFVSHGILAAQNGRIWVERTEVGAGTTMAFALPIRTSPRALKAQPAPALPGLVTNGTGGVGPVPIA